MTENTSVVAWGQGTRRGDCKGTQNNLGGYSKCLLSSCDEHFICVYICETPSIVPFKFMHFIVCQLYLTKVVKMI